jgi:hypothetical protein
MLRKVGDIYVNPITEEKYECVAKITTTPTYTNKDGITMKIWKDVTYTKGGGEPAKTIVLRDEDGNEFVAVLVDEEVDFTATADDIREGKVAATDDGVTIGEKYIPTYYATQGTKMITVGKAFSIRLPDYDLYEYSKFQAMICSYNKSIAKSVSCEQVVIDGRLYDVLSTVSLSDILLDHDNKTIDFGIKNETGSPYLIRYFTFKEV